MYDLNCASHKFHKFYAYYMNTKDFSELINKIGTDVEIHANIQTIVGTYINRFKYDDRFTNIQIMCSEDEKLPVLSELYKGAFDLNNKVYWLNKNTPISIIVDDEVPNGYSLIIQNGQVLGYYYCSEME